ncbi:hypothetical protein [Mycobacteroides chelonae]|uniref:Uncharacterized protein n=1 Tax=Mycobacteroides chelonae TaxID=1774 RepID=A0A1S1LZJ9_MYCCH|nr:hypothetical protein [Mycobacteroides chelonae]OHU76068.1 hypothetical protein BKG84_24550 [Mycobacteroides chelonae]
MSAISLRVPVTDLRDGDAVEVVENTGCKVAVQCVTPKPETGQVQIAGILMTGERKGEQVCFTCMDQETAVTERNSLPLTRRWAARMWKRHRSVRGGLS